MANPQTRFRSISFPPRLYPTNFEAYLHNLKSCEKNNIITSEAIQSGLVVLAELYNSTQQSLAFKDANSIEESLSVSVELLDACSTIRELFQMIKENIQALQSALRRKGLECSHDITSYICLRKRMNKSTAKTLGNLEQNKSSRNLLTGVAITIFRSTLIFLSCPISRPGGWALVSKLMNVTTAANSDVKNEVGNVDLSLSLLKGKMKNNVATVFDVQMVQKKLQNLESIIEGFEGGLDGLFRQLVQNRVRFLNILTDSI